MPLRWQTKAMLALSVMGTAIAFYHAYAEITLTFTSCFISQHLNCESVFNSGYTTFPPAGSIPGLGKSIDFWVYGVVWFPVCAAVSLWSMRKYGGPKAAVVVPFLMVGNLFTLYPWDVEIRILHGTYCPVCVSLYFVNYIMTFVALSYRPAEPELPENEP